MPRVLRIVLRPAFLAILWCARTFLKVDRLERIELVDLGMPIEDVFALYDYDEPVESEPDQYLPAATVHTMTAGPFHTVVVVEWKGKVCLVAYLPDYPHPNRDLKCMLDKYGQGIGWRELEPGYVCIRNDDQVWLRCSAGPGISVETVEYLDAKREES